METREAITLDTKAQQRLAVLTHVLVGELALETAATWVVPPNHRPSPRHHQGVPIAFQR